MTDPLVSVLIPCFNAARYIGETLECVFRQTWPEIEIIVVDDGSTDDSADVIRRFARSNLVHVECKNRGAAVSRNEAFERSRGAFIQYLDADDLISPNKVALQVRRLIERPLCIASCEWGRFYNKPQETQFNPELVWRDLSPLEWLAASRANGLGMMFPALWLIPRPIVALAGPWHADLTVFDDTEYFTRVILHAHHVLFCAGARAYYRSGVSGSLSGRKSPIAWASQFKAIELSERQVLAREDSERMRRAFSLSWQHLAHGAYPYDSALAERAIARSQALHSIRIMPSGGLRFRWLSRIVGWRNARRLQVVSGRE
jgi:glycosyltransferase involved in cell wall biosynthesis